MEVDLIKQIVIFTDGACSGNPGPGGWGGVVALPEGEIIELAGHEDNTTNNRMEILAAIRCLREVKSRNERVVLFTDSTYLIRGITQWIWGWKKKGWKTAEGEEVSNRDLWEDLLSLVGSRPAAGKIDWRYSRGHVGTPGNERCDEIAVAFSMKKYIKLYRGPLLQYDVAIYDVPEDQGLPEMRNIEKKPPAFSYLSFLNGSVSRHRTWPSCEKRVKGKSGAKFKKAMSQQDEAGILKEWGLSSSVQIKDEE